jgi:hypothetical protein
VVSVCGQNRPNPQTGSQQKSHEEHQQITHQPQQQWPILTRENVAGFNPRTETLAAPHSDRSDEIPQTEIPENGT